MNELKPEDVMKALELKVQRYLMPNVDIDGTVQVEDAERWFLSLLKEKLAPYVNALLREKDAEIERLTAQIEHCDACDRIGLTHSEHIVCIKQARAEAITAFVDGCVKMAIGLGGIPVVCLESIFQFAKKMKEEKDGESDL